MATAIVTGSGGLIGSESVSYFVEAGYDVIGLENDMRSYFFGRAVRADCWPGARLGHRAGAAHRRPSLVDQRPGRIQGGSSGVGAPVRVDEILREIYEQNVESWSAATAR